jgi:hypothetical protein
MPPERGGIRSEIGLLAFLFLLGAFALLISDTAAGLASGLTRGLAFAATAVLCAFAEILGLESLYTHDCSSVKFYIYLIIARFFS